MVGSTEAYETADAEAFDERKHEEEHQEPVDEAVTESIETEGIDSDSFSHFDGDERKRTTRLQAFHDPFRKQLRASQQ